MRTSTLATGFAERSGVVRVLLLDLKIEDVRRVRGLLDGETGFRVQNARSLDEGRQALLTGTFDVALIETSLWNPDTDGLARLVRDHHLDTIIVLLTSGSEPAPAVKPGAHDVISLATIADSHEMASRILAAIEETRAIRRRDTMVRWLEREARTDHLTGMLNRRAFDEQFENACRSARTRNESLVLILVDVTGTQQVNEAYGQATGDAMIRRAARSITRSIRGGDVAARVGGDDFGIVVEGGDIELGRHIARRIAQDIERLNNEDLDGEIPLSVSFGVASGLACDPDELFAAADEQLSAQRSVRPALTPFFLRSEQDGPSVA